VRAVLKLHNKAEVAFELEEEIGIEGKNSRVFRARDPQLEARIVIKQVPKNAIAHIDEYFAESSRLYISAHPNVVPIHYACQDTDHVYLAMPYFAKGSLKGLLATRALTVREIVTLGTQFLSGLHHIHSKGLIHFDVKPDNVLISNRGEALLSDFGLAKPVSLEGVAGQDRLYGKMTPPEAFDTDQFTTRFDIYQVGLTIFRMCVGDAEFYRQYESFIENGTLRRDDFRFAVRNLRFPDTGTYPPHIPQVLRNTVRHCLRTDPSERLPSALAAVNELSNIEGAMLDWQYEESATGRTWIKITDDRTYSLAVATNGESIALRRPSSGKQTKIREFCQKDIPAKEIQRFLREH